MYKCGTASILIVQPQKIVIFYQEDIMEKKTKLHTCKTCGKTSLEAGHLCDPVELKKAFVCEDCGASSLDAKHICKPKLQKLKYTCKKCGRLSVKSDKLCEPAEI